MLDMFDLKGFPYYTSFGDSPEEDNDDFEEVKDEEFSFDEEFEEEDDFDDDEAEEEFGDEDDY